MIEKAENSSCTDIEQSKKLIEIGISIDTADRQIVEGITSGYVVFDKKGFLDGLFDGDTDLKATPAWSVDALYKIIADAAEDTEMFAKMIAINKLTKDLKI